MDVYGEHGEPLFLEEGLVRLVLDGRKPGALVCLIGKEGDLAARGLHVYQTGSVHSMDRKPNMLAISLDQTVGQVLDTAALPVIPPIETALRVLAEQLIDKSVAEALALLNDMSRYDDEAIHISMHGESLERPEAAVLEGILLGYRPCDIEYYYATRYAGVPRDMRSESKIFSSNVLVNSHIVCPECVEKGLFE